MKVFKFGGTSVSRPQKIKKILEGEIKTSKQIIVVVSAFSGITDLLSQVGIFAASRSEEYKKTLTEIIDFHDGLIEKLFTDTNKWHKEYTALKIELKEIISGIYLLKELSSRSLDLLLSFGERLSSLIIAQYLEQNNVPSSNIDARDIIITNSSHGKALVNYKVTEKNIRDYLNLPNKIPIVTGFIASTDNGVTTTLGRGGSDYTAAIIGATLNAEEITIWTDVDGFMTADPKKVPESFTISSLSYEEAMELTHWGAKVLHPPTIQPALVKKIPIKIKNTLHPEKEGTIIDMSSKHSPFLIKGISSINDICLLRVQGSGMIGVSGISHRLFRALAEESINVILITQASSEHSICVAICPDQAHKAEELIRKEFSLELNNQIIDNIIIEKNLSIIATVGENMRKTPGIAGKLLSALGKNGINVSAIAQGSSELNISLIIPKEDEVKALNAIHDMFFLSSVRGIHLFLVGVGLIGKELLRQIKQQMDYYKENLQIEPRLIGVCRSTKMLIDKKGIDLNNWETQFTDQALSGNIEAFTKEMTKLNLPNSIFIDCTANQDVVDHYEEVIKNNISIVTPNKLANILPYKRYCNLRELTKKKNIQLMYETNVGAGLPVINTLKDLLISGDRIYKIEGIFSGTLSFLFNEFMATEKKFYDILKEAMEKGFTEPDPRIDLSGHDVARKLLILIRELGIVNEFTDIPIPSFLPESCEKAKSIEDFLQNLQKETPYFENMKAKALKNNKTLRYIASYKDKKANVGLEEINDQHPFYHLSGSDNIIAFTTERYKDTPLVVKGPGAGAEVTAAGVLADTIRTANYIL